MRNNPLFIFMPNSLLDLTGLDIVGEPDDNDKRSLAEVAALAASDRMVAPTQETTELYLRLNEENTNSVRGFRWENQEDFVDPDRVGVILHENEFLTRLGKLGTFKPNDWSRHGMRGLNIFWQGKWKYLFAIQRGYAPEFSLMNFNEHQLPTTEKYRGWRGTVLLRLILGGYITEEAAHAEFGPPMLTRATLRYRLKLWKYRNGRK